MVKRLFAPDIGQEQSKDDVIQDDGSWIEQSEVEYGDIIVPSTFFPILSEVEQTDPISALVRGVVDRKPWHLDTD